jgi:hypothetical protein
VALGSRDAEGLKPSEIDAWLSAHSKWSPATANRYKTVLSKAYQLAVKNGDVSTNPPASLTIGQRTTDAALHVLTLNIVAMMYSIDHSRLC